MSCHSNAHDIYHGDVSANSKPSSGVLGVHTVSERNILTMTYIYIHQIGNSEPHLTPPANGRKKHHQRKLQLVLTTMCASGVLVPFDGRISPPAQGAINTVQIAIYTTTLNK